MKFSTLDQDNDLDGGSCAAKYKGAWWYASCHYSNLNGKYQRPGGFTYAEGINWYTFRGDRTSMKFTEMKLRPFDFWIFYRLPLLAEIYRDEHHTA